MAGTGTVSQLAGRVFDFRTFGFLVWAGLVIVAVTARAIRLESGESPVDHFRIALMTLCALQIATMIQRLIGQSDMAVVGRCPRIRVMAQTTVLRRIKVARGHAGRGGAVVAGRAGAENLAMVDADYWLPGIGAVAVFADIGRLHMQGSFASSIDTVVTANAIVDDIHMVEIRRYPGDACMAVIAVVATGNMGRMLACRRNTVMAGATSSDDLRVIDRISGYPDIRRMAVFTDSR